MPDPRCRRGVRHSLPGLLAVAIAAVVSGARSFAAIGQWVGDADADLLASLGFRLGQRPSESAIRRAFGRLDAAQLDAVLGAWMWTRTRVVDQRRVIAIDGKTIRGAQEPRQHGAAPDRRLRPRSRCRPRTTRGGCQEQRDPRRTEAARRVFDLAGVVVTVDAMHTQNDTAQSSSGPAVTMCSPSRPTSRRCSRRARQLPWRRRTGQQGHQQGPRPSRHPHHQGRHRPAWVELPRCGPGRPSSAEPLPGTERRPSRSSTSSPPPPHEPPHRQRSPHGSRATGASRTDCIGSGTSPSTRTAPRSDAAPDHRS